MRTALAIALTAIALSGAPARASSLPLRVSFQGRLTDPATNNPRNGAYDMTFRLYAAPSGGSALYTETQLQVPVSNGVFSTQLGSITALSPDLFASASSYLGITVSPDAAEMTPRQRLAMAPYAFTAAQLVADSAARVQVGTVYSTFTAAGGLTLPGALSAGSVGAAGGVSASDVSAAYGVSGATATFSAGLTASSGTFTATGATQYSVQAASGIFLAAGTLEADGSGGVSAPAGVSASTAALTAYLHSYGAAAQDAAPAGSGRIYFASASNRYQVSENGGSYARLVAPSGSQNLWDTNATAGVTNQGLNLPAALTELDAAVEGTRVVINCDDLGGQFAMRYNVRNLTATALTIVVHINDTSNTSNVLAGVSIPVAATANVSYTGETAYAAKPAWCTGNKEIGVWTSGGNGAADYIFKRIGLIWKP
ncbi:MAG TPA: hypothetical protein VN915_04030 [Elusimicrobiota bacterium]|nr:hypothetical protein [Elusimicrobiota bacterium]